MGNSPSFDIEHTIPRSLSFDNSQQNKTLCQNRFNRETKRNKIPFELTNHAQILDRIEGWKKRYEELDAKIQKLRKVSTSDKESKDRVIHVSILSPLLFYHIICSFKKICDESHIICVV